MENKSEYSMFEYYGIGKKPGPKYEKSEQNQKWDENRLMPKVYHHPSKVIHKKIYNKKYTNSLTSHKGESRVSRADKMSGTAYKEQGKSKTFIKEFYTRKRRMFLKNENNWEKI